MAIYSEHCITKRVPWGSYSQERNPLDPLLSRGDCRETDNFFLHFELRSKAVSRLLLSWLEISIWALSFAECVVFSCTNAEWLICVLVA